VISHLFIVITYSTLYLAMRNATETHISSIEKLETMLVVARMAPDILQECYKLTENFLWMLRLLKPYKLKSVKS